ncbi:centrosomal protein 43-like [Coccinella septempunctata]|uniref:centrosomal protein 43-like n=1 Tax=Coccinella septempunctata TaxID=41139 RepID=UPI001D091042|nr:centrosomal protein 43-like [Coccinella septempunctata]
MSIEDETELKDLLLQTLSENGSLAKIKAQLRASVFLALEEDINTSSRKPLLNEKIKSSLNTPEGQLMFCIVKEFLEFFNLQSTMAVFDAESYLGVSYDYKDRGKISKDLGLQFQDNTAPLLQSIIQIAQQKPRTLEVNLNINEKHAETVENNISSGSNSIKTETSMSDENSDSGTSDVKNNRINRYHKEISGDVSSEYDQENEYNVSLNKTFTTESRETLNSSENSINGNGDSMYDGQGNVSEVLNNTTQTTIPISAPDKHDEVTAPVVKDLKISPERVKSPPKSDKFKSKNNLNSLSDLPPLTMNKSLSGKILPSLYTKEFREKPNS